LLDAVAWPETAARRWTTDTARQEGHRRSSKCGLLGGEVVASEYTTVVQVCELLKSCQDVGRQIGGACDPASAVGVTPSISTKYPTHR
jgi:hypothetical protein